MANFVHYQPTKIFFGSGKVNQIGEISSNYGKRCLLVTYHPSKLSDPQKAYCEKAEKNLEQVGINVANYYGALPNPTTECVDEGVLAARQNKVDFILALGGGSVIDTAKMIAFWVANPDINWEILFSEYSTPFSLKEPLCLTPLPLIAIPTTSGTGSQVTQAAVITDMRTKHKTSVFHTLFFPKTCVIDPELMISVPPQVTADTGFDAFSHAFESYINRNATPFSEILSLEAIRLIFKWLPQVIKNGRDLEARESMSIADTLAGMSLSIAGAALPHPLGEMIGSLFPEISHGRSMAVIYPEFMRFASISANEKFGTIGRMLKPRLNNVPDQIASVKACGEFDKFLKKIGMWISFKDLKITLTDLKDIPAMLAPITTHISPRSASEEDIWNILNNAKKR